MVLTHDRLYEFDRRQHDEAVCGKQELAIMRRYQAIATRWVQWTRHTHIRVEGKFCHKSKLKVDDSRRTIRARGPFSMLLINALDVH